VASDKERDRPPRFALILGEKPVSDASDTLLKKGLGARVTLRLSERELTALRDLAEAREEDLTSIIREAIGAYLRREKDEAAHRAEHQRLGAEMTAGVKREADRVIERHEHTMRALIEALNVHLMTAKPGAGRR
jgi:predicted transcriptional regulator